MEDLQDEAQADARLAALDVTEESDSNAGQRRGARLIRGGLATRSADQRTQVGGGANLHRLLVGARR